MRNNFSRTRTLSKLILHWPDELCWLEYSLLEKPLGNSSDWEHLVFVEKYTWLVGLVKHVIQRIRGKYLLKYIYAHTFPAVQQCNVTFPIASYFKQVCFCLCRCYQLCLCLCHYHCQCHKCQFMLSHSSWNFFCLFDCELLLNEVLI